MTDLSDGQGRAPGGLSRRTFVRSLIAGGAALGAAPSVFAHPHPPRHAQGVVYHDRDGDGKRGPDDVGLEGVAVSNGRDVTLTDEKGRWRLPLEGEPTTLFVIKPRGWMVPVGEHNLTRPHYIYQPHGSPQQKYAGVAPTGHLPGSIDFALRPQDEPDRFTALVCGDPQPRNLLEIGYLAQTVVPELKGAEAAFGVSLGDIMFDDLSLYGPLNEAFGLIGLPWRNVLGNHDLNYDAPDSRHAYETFRSVYGPTYYAFDHGPVHFLVLNNVEWQGKDPERPGSSGSYRGKLGERQLEFIANDLKLVPKDRLVVLFMHIPLTPGERSAPSVETADRQELYRLLEDRPHTLSFAAHMHWHGHLFLGSDDGWRGAAPHHHIVTGTLCGSWFGGAPDEQGVPHSTMSDGAPRGYLKVEFDGPRYNIDGYQALGRPSSHQMNIEVAGEIPQSQLGETSLHVNVFNGSERSKVRMRLDGGELWQELERTVAPDPAFVRLHERDRRLEAPYRGLPAPGQCLHLWRGALPADLAPGTHLIEIVSEDMFGNVHRGVRPIRVLA